MQVSPVELVAYQLSSYEGGAIGLASGDRVLLFTDGVTEAVNTAGEEFGEGRLIELLVENGRLGTTELQRRVMEAVADFCGGNFHDDATLVVLSVK